MRVLSTLTIASVLAFAAGPALALQAAQFQGSWRLPDGTCEAPFYTASEMTKTRRDEVAIKAIVRHMGKTVEGLMIIEGARRSQVVSPETDMAIFLVNSPGNGPSLIPMNADVRGWPEVKLEKCPVAPAAP